MDVSLQLTAMTLSTARESLTVARTAPPTDAVSDPAGAAAVTSDVVLELSSAAQELLSAGGGSAPGA